MSSFVLRSQGVALVLMLSGLATGLCLMMADVLNAQAPETAPVELTARFANDSGSEVRISVRRWSTDEERNRLIAALNPPPPVAPDEPPEGGRGGRGRGGRGSEPVDPIAATLDEADTVGSILTESVVGYTIKYAHRSQMAGGGERIVLATTRLLGPRMSAQDVPTLIEIRLDAGGTGEARMSRLNRATAEDQASTIVLRDYAAARPILEDVR